MGLNQWVGGKCMRSYLTSTRLMTKLGMLRCGKKSKAFVVVEGVTDYRVYSKLFDPAVCEVIIGESKENVIEAIKMCEEKQMEGIIGIVDADFWHTRQYPPKLPKTLFVTDYHDLECMMLNSKAFEHVLLEYSDLNKVARFEGRCKERLKNMMLENVALIGYLRKLSLEKHMDLNFSNLNYSEFVYINDLKVKEEQLVKHLLFVSHKQNQYEAALVSKWMRNEMKPYDDLWQICCGHDLMEWLTLGLVHLFGNYNAKKLFAGQLEGSFRLAYHEGLFIETQLYRGLQEWESQNPTYHLFSLPNMNQVI